MNELNRMLDKIESQLGARSKSEIFELDNDIYMGLKNTSFIYKPNLNYSRIDKPTLRYNNIIKNNINNNYKNSYN